MKAHGGLTQRLTERFTEGSLRAHRRLMPSRVPARRTRGSRDLGSKGTRELGNEGAREIPPGTSRPPARLGPYRATATARPRRDPHPGYRASGDPDRPLGPCRVCGTPSWLADDRGPVHRCCARAEAHGERECLACRAAWAAADRRARHEITRGAVAGDDQTGGRA